jgi:hypothetical protein
MGEGDLTRSQAPLGKPHFPEALLRGIIASMTRSRYRTFETECPYFLTNTIVG